VRYVNGGLRRDDSGAGEQGERQRSLDSFYRPSSIHSARLTLSMKVENARRRGSSGERTGWFMRASPLNTGIFVALGAAIGAATGAAFHEIALGVAVGVVLGVVMGVVTGRTRF
jgi:hypothetical protein